MSTEGTNPDNINTEYFLTLDKIKQGNKVSKEKESPESDPNQIDFTKLDTKEFIGPKDLTNLYMDDKLEQIFVGNTIVGLFKAPDKKEYLGIRLFPDAEILWFVVTPEETAYILNHLKGEVF